MNKDRISIPASRFEQYDEVYFPLKTASGEEVLFRDCISRRSYELDAGTWWYYLENLKRWVTDHDLYAHDANFPSSKLKIE